MLTQEQYLINGINKVFARRNARDTDDYRSAMRKAIRTFIYELRMTRDDTSTKFLYLKLRTF